MKEQKKKPGRRLFGLVAAAILAGVLTGGAGAAVLWLKADLELLWSRVRHKTTRPLLRTATPKATLSALNAARTPVYALAPLSVHVQPDWSIEETAEHVIAELARAGAVEGYGT